MRRCSEGIETQQCKRGCSVRPWSDHPQIHKSRKRRRGKASVMTTARTRDGGATTTWLAPNPSISFLTPYTVHLRAHIELIMWGRGSQECFLIVCIVHTFTGQTWATSNCLYEISSCCVSLSLCTSIVYCLQCTVSIHSAENYIGIKANFMQ